MTRPVRISIIIPCLNEGAGIVAALEAVSRLRARGAEVIVVDGDSGDNTAALAAAHADRVLHARRGRGRQMNAGATVASGDVLLFLHADTRLPAGADELIGHALGAGARQWGRFDVAISGAHPLLRVIGACMNVRSRWTGVATGDQAIFVTRSLFERAGRYPQIALMEDIALTSVLKRLARPACLRQRVVTSGRRWREHGVLRTMCLMWRLRFAYWCGADPDELAVRYAPHRQP